MKRITAFAVLLFAATAFSQVAYPIFETDKIPISEHKERRERLKQQIGEGSIGIFFSNPVRNRNNDVDYRYRQDSNFLYLTGLEEPDAVLVLMPSGVEIEGKRVTEVIFSRRPTAQSLTWDGYLMGPENVEKILGIEKALINTEFEARLPILAQAAVNKTYVTTGIPSAPTGTLARMTAAFTSWQQSSGFTDQRNGRQLLSRMREIKSPEEIRLIRRATEISALAHVEAMRSIRPGMWEYEISALYEYVFMREGCEYPAYPPIVASGPNSVILHYNTNRRRMQDGDIICVDAAGEFRGYASDVTRSYPVNGKFSPEQKAIYEIVLRAQEAGIAACRVGATTSQIGAICSRILAEGLMELGIISSANELRRYYMHGFGHGVGLDVHDPMPGTLRAGAVLTVEPGIYIRAGSPCDQKWWNIGIRIEDVIWVTEEGPVNFSASAPRTVADIERLMSETGIGNLPIRPAGR